MFQGTESFPAELAIWAERLPKIRSARFAALPGDRVRYEVASLDGAYTTGLWQLPRFKVIEEDTVSSAKPLFRDATGHVFRGVPSFEAQMLRGNPWWRARLDSAAGIDVYGNQGIAAGDADGDGVDEVYVCQPGGLPNRLYKFREDGTAEDITERAGVGVLDDSTCALFLDLMNSGRQDLVVLRAAGPLLFRNLGGGRFQEQEGAFRFRTKPQGSFTGMAAADYDRDGRLDLYLCCYVYFQSEDQYQYPAPYHDARNGPPNFLLRNQLTAEGGQFEDVTESVGLSENNDRFSFAPAWCDFDGDGWPDLYVANDFGRNNLYRNREGRFRDESAKAGVEDIGPGMSASWFDYDGDGLADLYVSNMWTAPGQRIVADAAFPVNAANSDPELREAYRRHSKGNSLYRNRGDGSFEETGPAQRAEMGRWAWSSGAFDFDLDGSPEIYITTGMLTNPGATDLNSFFWRQTVAKSPATQRSAPEYENGWNAINQLIRQDYCWNGHEPNVLLARRNGRFRDYSGVSGIDFAEDSRAFAVTDFDGDGNLDIVLKSRLAPQVRVLQNDCGVGKPALSIALRGTKSNRDGIGAKVELNGQTQWVSAGSGFLSQHTKRLYFGLAGRDSGEGKITWPSGLVQQLTGLRPGYRYEIAEGEQDYSKQPFRQRKNFPKESVKPLNAPEPADTWLLEPVPTPDRRRGPGFLMLHAGQNSRFPATVPVEALDLTRESKDVAAAYALLRRYLFEYRTDLAVPTTLLLDAESRVRKVYGGVPAEARMREDLSRMDRSAALALPFGGKYYTAPHRNYFKLGAAFYWAGYPDKALPYLREVVRTRPENWKAQLAIGRIEQELGRNVEALETLRKVARLRPGDAQVLVSLGESYVSLNDRAMARAAFEKALVADATSADAANQMGLLDAAAEKYDAARKWFQQAIAAQRDHSGAINNLGVLYAKIGQTADAIAAFRYGIDVAPDDEMLYLNLGRVYVGAGQREQAKEAFTRLLERKPASTVASKALAELEAR